MWVVYNKNIMIDYELFKVAFGLGNDCFVVKSDFNQDPKRLDIYLFYAYRNIDNAHADMLVG